MTRPRLLDLFCGAGGAAMGYHRAGFDVTGVDIRPQPRYPFTFIQGDAMTFPLAGWDAIHASPPCQDYMRSKMPGQKDHGTGWMLAATRERLQASGVPWVIENVPGAAIRADFKLCGCMAGLPRLRRQRWFETWPPMFDLRPPCVHVERAVKSVGGGDRRGTGNTAQARRDAMGIDWMTRDECAQAIPPAYTEYIGAQLLEQISEPRAAAQEALL